MQCINILQCLCYDVEGILPAWLFWSTFPLEGNVTTIDTTFLCIHHL